jgi:ribosomal protein S18 acetylase RimI-like enzyme
MAALQRLNHPPCRAPTGRPIAASWRRQQSTTTTARRRTAGGAGVFGVGIGVGARRRTLVAVVVAAAPAPAPPPAALSTELRNFSMEFELRPPASSAGQASPDGGTPATTTATATTATATAATTTTATQTTPTTTTTTRLRVAPLPLALLPAAADLLAGTFILSTSASDGQGPPRPSLQPYARFVRRRIAKYLDEHLRPEAKTLVLAATVPLEGAAEGAAAAAAAGGNDGDGGEEKEAEEEDEAAKARKWQRAVADRERQRMEDETWDAVFSARIGGGGGRLPGRAAAATSNDAAAVRPRPPPSPHPPVLLVGTAELSLDSTTRSRYLTLNPPPDAAYLMNTAVSEAFRRRGVARSLVRAVDAAAAAAGAEFVWLHARPIDAPAVALYRSLGFEVVATDGWWVVLLGKDRRHLMRRAVGGGGGAGEEGGG